MNPDRALRDHVIHLLEGGGAHGSLVDLLRAWPPALRGAKPEGQPHTPWRLLEHIRIAQADILGFSKDPKHVSPDWPDGYWPPEDAPADAAAWDASVAAVAEDLAAMVALVDEAQNDLVRPFTWGDGQTLLREALLVADHNAWHGGQLALLRRLVERSD